MALIMKTVFSQGLAIPKPPPPAEPAQEAAQEKPQEAPAPVQAPTPPTQSAEGSETILDALRALAKGENPHSTLMFISNRTGETFRVLKHDPDTGESLLLSSAYNVKFSVRIGEREVPLYKHLWR